MTLKRRLSYVLQDHLADALACGASNRQAHPPVKLLDADGKLLSAEWASYLDALVVGLLLHTRANI
jgi:hypothetical protein